MKKMATLGVGEILNQSCCCGYQSSDGNIFLNLFSINSLRPSDAYMRR